MDGRELQAAAEARMRTLTHVVLTLWFMAATAALGSLVITLLWR
jgi:hypothetical protein